MGVKEWRFKSESPIEELRAQLIVEYYPDNFENCLATEYVLSYQMVGKISGAARIAVSLRALRNDSWR